MNHKYDDKWDNPKYHAAIQRNIRINAAKGRRKRWFERDDRAEEIFQYCWENQTNSFCQSMLETIQDWGELSDKQRAAMVKIIDGRAQREAERKANALKSNFVGKVGERTSFEGVVTFKASYETMWGEQTVVGIKQGDDIIIAKGTSDINWAQKGHTVKFDAMVKDHNERDGEKQTIINRPTKIFIEGFEAKTIMSRFDEWQMHIGG